MAWLGAADLETAAAEALLNRAELAGDPADDLGWCRLHQLEAYLDLAAERAAPAAALKRYVAKGAELPAARVRDWLDARA
jgi:hypothetical protein